MARELSITITADPTRAVAGLAKVEGAIGDVSKASGKVDKQIDQEMRDRESAARKLGAVIGGAFSLEKIGAAVSQVAADTSAIADASAKMGIGAESVQKLAYAAQQAGGSLDSVATAMGFMANVLGNDKAGAKALAQVGLTFQDIKNLTPDQTFIAIADAIAKIPDPLRQADAARDVFGRGALELLPAIKAGFENVGNQAPIMSAAVVQAGDEAGDKLDRMHRQMDNLKAQALVPLMEAFTQLPQAVQVGTAGLLSFLPSTETLILGVMALGGPAGALAVLTGAFATVATFLTTTLPAAFGTILAFLGPQGLIAVALIALGLVWYKWGDDITAIVKKVYEAIKAWLVDKFNAVVASIKQKIEAITGYFKGMYDAVVGHSYVPDMIEGIGYQFGRLGELMVDPVKGAVHIVEDLFRNMLSNVTNMLMNWVTSVLPGWAGKILGGGGLGRMAGGAALGGLAGGGGGFAASAVSGVESAALGGGGGLGALGGLLTNPWTIGIGAAALGIGWLVKKGLFRGGEEGTVVNPKRDQFLAQFGPAGTGLGSGFNNLAAKLTRLTGQEGGGALFAALARASSYKDFQRAEDDIISLLAANGTGGIKRFDRGGFVKPGEVRTAVLHGGGKGELAAPIETLVDMLSARLGNLGGTHHHYHAVDSRGMERLVRDTISPLLSRMKSNNTNGALTLDRRLVRP